MRRRQSVWSRPVDVAMLSYFDPAFPGALPFFFQKSDKSFACDPRKVIGETSKS
ncbi:hypothetical protein REMIM1_PB00152 (plasmid) [Rhizobium etli bv. mimosae str. Mim1]|nr:hypothetical protein REMIM1_PB00152 [Rhizobium etli bv. mimosae str. Mim1]